MTDPDLINQHPHRTNLGDAERLVALHGHHIRYVEGLGFLVWDGKRWARDAERLRITQLAADSTRTLQELALLVKSQQEREAWGKWAFTGEHRSRLVNCVSLAASIPQIRAEADDFDADPDLLNVENGTLNLRTGKLKKHDPADLITKLAPVTFDPDAACPKWDAFQERTADGDAELIAYKRRAFGYSITGHTVEDALFIAYGTGANGKSTELGALQALAGDYGDVARFDSFAAKRDGGGIPNDIAKLHGARLVSAYESESQQRLAEGLVKQLTGGDVVTARFLHQEFFTFTPRFKIWLVTNHKPIIRGTDNGIWRRIRLIPYTVSIPLSAQDKKLDEKLEAELSGILNRVLAGARDWYARGLGNAPAVETATQGYRQDSDILHDFLEAFCDSSDPSFVTPSGELYNAYVSWCVAEREEYVKPSLFGRMLTERGFAGDTVRIKSKPTKVRHGLRLLEPENAENDNDLISLSTSEFKKGGPGEN